MKSLVTVLLQLVKDRSSRVNIVALLRFLAIIAVMITTYSIIFHYIMEYEGRSESWITGFYWTLTVMSTLGFGDITFHSDLGRLFSVVVLVSGVMFLLILLPFTFIEFFYAPWLKAQQMARAPTQLPEKTSGHVILTHFDLVTQSLIEKLKQYDYPYVLIIPDLTEALRLHDMGYKVMVGDLDDPQTYQRARVHQALFVATTANDQVNANVAFTVREISETVKMLGTANAAASVDLLELAGCSYVVQLAEMMADSLVRQVVNGKTTAHVIGRFDDLLIAEASVQGTDLIGKTLQETQLREKLGVNVLGVWSRGKFELATPSTPIANHSILIMAGKRDHITRYNALYHQDLPESIAPVIIIGGGRVGRAVARNLATRGMDYRIIEKAPERIRDPQKYILGDAAEIEVLEIAGIRNATSIIITTHDDDMNVYLTIYCRRLCPDAQIISRANLERNIATLHRAGADFVMSYASTGATAIINSIGRDNILMMAEGLAMFEIPIPKMMVGKTLAQCDIRAKTGCTVVAVHTDTSVIAMPDPHMPLPAHSRLIIIGTPEAEETFLRQY
ncbi:MAG: potassium transporter TrkA [Phototrophicales bacterium]|nr:MAG: potassium transporter TrkA [Phototrophicales bacterium]